MSVGGSQLRVQVRGHPCGFGSLLPPFRELQGSNIESQLCGEHFPNAELSNWALFCCCCAEAPWPRQFTEEVAGVYVSESESVAILPGYMGGRQARCWNSS